MGQLVAGTAYVKVDGAQLTITGGAEAPLMQVKRETVAPGFYKEEDLAPYVKLTAVLAPDLDIKKIINGRDMTVTCEFKNGKVYVLAGAYLVDEPTYKGDDGTAELQFDGIKGTWQ
ncbi:phage tail tube protein [Pseudomonas sp. QD4]|uniref:phage tail tube protein n=1 Tax=Pseudomonas sp. QD4 TaxID=3368618 RepID=UPI003BA07B7D